MPATKDTRNAMMPSLARVVLIAALATSSVASAAPLPPVEGDVTYAVVDQDLRDVVTEVTRQFGFRLNLSDAVHGRVRGRLPPGPFETVLNRLAKTYGLDWYFDGGTLWISAASEASSKMLSLGTVDPVQLTRSLDTLGFSDSRWPLRSSADAKLAIVDGPPRYVQLVEQVVGFLGQRGSRTGGVVVFRGSVGGP